MMVIVAHAIFVESDRTNGLNLAQRTTLNHRGEGVVNRLLGDRTKFLGGNGCDLLGCGVRVAVHSTQHGKTLRGHWHAVRAQRGERVKEHAVTIPEFWNESKSLKTPEIAGLVGVV
jgi:hypothetical protein